MAAPLSEFVLESVLRDGLNELRLSPSRLDDIFGGFLETHFENQYGQSKIDELKTYITNNQVKLIHAMALIPTVMPCISIQMVSSAEDESLQEFSNMLPEEDSVIEPIERVPVVEPIAYDALTGRLTIENSADLSMICPGMLYVDASNVEFTILGASNLSGSKFITLKSQQEVDITDDGKVISSIKKARMDRRMIRLRETIHIGCHAANDLHLAKFLYILVVYIIKSRQEAMENRGLALDRGIASSFEKLGEPFEDSHVYSRFIELNCITQFEWDQSEVNLIDCFDATIKTNRPNPESEEAAPYNPSDQD